MIYQGKAFSVLALNDGVAELRFDLQGESVNKFNEAALADLDAAIQAIKADSSIKGIVLTSGKEGIFIVGADIMEFTSTFKQEESALMEMVMGVNRIFTSLEDLDIPSVAAINGAALGGGFEVCLCTDYRVIATSGSVGLPEVKLGIYPGWGGTVRLPRVIGADNAVEWIASGRDQKPAAALKVGAVDAVVAPEKLLDSAVSLVKKCIAGELDYKARKEEKRAALKLNDMENIMVFETTMAVVRQQAGHMRAPVESVKTIKKHAQLTRDEALKVEAEGFIKLCKSEQSDVLIGLFLNDQLLKKKVKAYSKVAGKVEQAAVLGAGIMGGGIAYQSANKGTPILMKDIAQDGLNLGLAEANKLLAKRVARGRMDPGKMGEVLNHIVPTLSYSEFGSVDVVVEAVVENVKVKKAVLAEVEGQVSEDTVLTSNTSTISITELAKDLKRPENFCGMHFFNPVHAMPLVEVIRGEKTSDKTVATVVKYAKQMGKVPIVVNDCPGFMVNRVLFPYFGGFSTLVRDGADFQQVDKVMEKFGWPMGPAYLLDVVGIDTACHAEQVMAEGFPDRMSRTDKTATDVMFEKGRFGQKTGEGFYKYEQDKKGKPKKTADDVSYQLLSDVSGESRAFEDQEIIDRMMIPLCLETVRTLEDGIVESAGEADLALLNGIGFPIFRGGALKYIDAMGVDKFVELADQYADLGPLYQATDKLREMARTGKTFYGA